MPPNNGSWGWNFTKGFFRLVSSVGWKSVYHNIVDEDGCDGCSSSTPFSQHSSGTSVWALRCRQVVDVISFETKSRPEAGQAAVTRPEGIFGYNGQPHQ